MSIVIHQFYRKPCTHRKSKTWSFSGYMGLCSTFVEEALVFNPSSWTIFYMIKRGSSIYSFHFYPVLIVQLPKMIKACKNSKITTSRNNCTMTSILPTNPSTSSNKPTSTFSPPNGVEQAIPVVCFYFTFTLVPKHQFSLSDDITCKNFVNTSAQSCSKTRKNCPLSFIVMQML